MTRPTRSATTAYGVAGMPLACSRCGPVSTGRLTPFAARNARVLASSRSLTSSARSFPGRPAATSVKAGSAEAQAPHSGRTNPYRIS
jgi:hypothetical protein